MAAKPFKMVFKRGGDTPKVYPGVKCASIAEAAVKAGEVHTKEAKDWKGVQLWYEVWNGDTLVRETIVQKAK